MDSRNYLTNYQTVYGYGNKINNNNNYLYQNFQNTDFLRTSDTSTNQSNLINLTNQNPYLLNNNVNYQTNFNFQGQRVNRPNTGKGKKRVKFNENVDIVLVESYKKYNQEGEDFSMGDYDDDNYDFTPSHKKRKKNTKCECNII